MGKRHQPRYRKENHGVDPAEFILRNKSQMFEGAMFIFPTMTEMYRDDGGVQRSHSSGRIWFCLPEINGFWSEMWNSTHEQKPKPCEDAAEAGRQINDPQCNMSCSDMGRKITQLVVIHSSKTNIKSQIAVNKSLQRHPVFWWDFCLVIMIAVMFGGTRGMDVSVGTASLPWRMWFQLCHCL